MAVAFACIGVLGITAANPSGNKIDWFLRRPVEYEVEVSSSGVAPDDLLVTVNGDPYP